MALRAALKDYEYNYATNETERHENNSILLNNILKYLNLQSIYELVGWSIVASKAEIADLAQLIIKLSVAGNPIAKQVVETAIEDLVNDIMCLIKRLKNDKKVDDNAIQIGFTGSLLSRSETFSKMVSQKLKERGFDANIVILKDTVIGALKMIKKTEESYETKINQNGNSFNQMSSEQLAQLVLPISTSLPSTEIRNKRSMNLDSMSVRDAIELMISEELNSFNEIRKNIDSIETLVLRITHAFRTNGRLFYVGSGTSGRLGVLDASECPPTFSCPRYLVQGMEQILFNRYINFVSKVFV